MLGFLVGQAYAAAPVVDATTQAAMTDITSGLSTAILGAIVVGLSAAGVIIVTKTALMTILHWFRGGAH